MRIHENASKIPFPARPSENDEKWLILGCPGQKTIHYETDLRIRGFDAFAPMGYISVRLPRRRKRVWRLIVHLPALVFIPARYEEAFGRLGYPYGHDCKIRRSETGEAWMAWGSELEALRKLDNREEPVSRNGQAQELFSVGDQVLLLVDLPELAGEEGVVTGSRSVDYSFSVAVKNSPREIWVSGFLLQKVTL